MIYLDDYIGKLLLIEKEHGILPVFNCEDNGSLFPALTPKRIKVQRVYGREFTKDILFSKPFIYAINIGHR